MKKSLMLGLVAFGAAAGSLRAQGLILLENYNTLGPYVTYGLSGIPKDGVSGTAGIVGNKINSPTGWTAGFYWAAGDQLANIDPNPGFFLPTGGGLALATGTGSTAQIDGALVGNSPGAFLAGAAYTTSGVAAGGTITVVVIAYSGSDFASATYRGHSAPFTMTVSDPAPQNPNKIGAFMPGPFSVVYVPEPSMLALLGVSGGLAFFHVRRRT